MVQYVMGIRSRIVRTSIPFLILTILVQKKDLWDNSGTLFVLFPFVYILLRGKLITFNLRDSTRERIESHKTLAFYILFDSFHGPDAQGLSLNLDHVINSIYASMFINRALIF